MQLPHLNSRKHQKTLNFKDEVLFHHLSSVLPALALAAAPPAAPPAAKLGVLKVHKRENFLGFDFKICTFSLLVMPKC